MRTSSRSVATLLVTALTALLFLVTAPAALATSFNWYSSSDPLNVYDGKVRGSAFGTSYKKDGYLKNHTYYRDRRSNGNGVYTQSDYSYYVVCSPLTSGSWCGKGPRDQSSRTQSGSWQDQYDRDDYSTQNADKGRVHSKVCEDQPWSPDPCSRRPYFTFNL